MATVIQIKRSSATSAPATLKLGELAYTYGTGAQNNLGDRIFIGEGGVDGNGDANNVSVIGGQYFTDMFCLLYTSTSPRDLSKYSIPSYA